VKTNILKSLFSKNINKSVFQGGYNNGTPTVSFMYNNTTGQILGTPRHKTFQDEIHINPTIQTIINKQQSIITEADLRLVESVSGKDIDVKNQEIKKLLDILLSPNTAPAMLSWNDIIRYFFNKYFYYGIGALVFTYNEDFERDERGQILRRQTIESYDTEEEKQRKILANLRYLRNLNIDNIQPAKTVRYSDTLDKIEYKITLHQKYTHELSFTQDEEMQGFYTARANGKYYIALIFGNYDYYTCQHQTFLEHIKPSILLENHIANTHQSFYENACMPSSIIEVTPSATDPKAVNDFLQMFGGGNEKEEVFKSMMQEMENKLKNNKGGAMISKDARWRFNVIPLQITPDATNAEKLVTMAKNDIYSFFAGGSRAAFEGQSEYASNALPKIKELYDGAIGFINSHLIDKLNGFLKLYLKAFKIVPLTQLNNYYFSLDTSQIQFYTEFKKEELNTMYTQNQITANEVRQKKGLIDDNLSDLTDLPNGDKLLIELGKGGNNNEL
jgi:hypothetical protein